MTQDGDLWVFGYGSLMWRPGFAFTEHGLRGFAVIIARSASIRMSIAERRSGRGLSWALTVAVPAVASSSG